MTNDSVATGEVCRKIELLRQQVRDLEKDFQSNTKEIRQNQISDNREIWLAIDKMREDIYTCKLNFTSFESSNTVKICDIERDFEDLSKDFKDIKNEISGLREDQKKDNAKIMDAVSEIKASSQKNSATIAIIVSIIILVLSKLFSG